MADRAGNLIDCISVFLKDKNKDGIPTHLPVTLPNSPEKQIQINIIEEVDKPSICYSAGDSIANSSSSDFKGSISCRVQLANKIECLITCSHVMTNGTPHNINGFFDNTSSCVINGQGDGKWFYGLLNEDFDIALIKNFNESDFGYAGNRKITKPRSLTTDDVLTTKVTMIGRRDFYQAPPKLNAIEGYIINHRAFDPISITYAGGIEMSIKNLIVISNKVAEPFQSISVPGDSGSIIIDENKYAIGMVIAQNSKFTYAIAFDRILKKLNATLC